MILNARLSTVFVTITVLIATQSLAQEPCYDPTNDTSAHARFEAAPAGEPFVLVLGDSNSLLRDTNQSWPSRLKQILGAHVMNAAIGGSIAGGAHPQDREDITEDLAFSGPKQFEKAKLSIEQGSDAIVLISMGGNDLMHFADTAEGVINDLETLRSTILADPIFDSVTVYFIKVAPFDPESPQGQEHGAKIDQINEHLESVYSASGQFIIHNPDLLHYTDAVHFDASEHLRRAELVKSHLIPQSDLRSIDTDKDLTTDGLEFFFGTSATDADTDDDGLGDTEELGLGTSPTNSDTDGDGSLDGVELARESGVAGGISSCQGVAFVGTAESFVGDSCPDTSSDPTKIFDEDSSIPNGVVDTDNDGCFEKGVACQSVELLASKASLQRELQSLHAMIRKVFRKRRKINKKCAWRKDKSLREIQGLTERDVEAQSFINEIPDSYDSCNTTEGLRCVTSQHGNTKTSLRELSSRYLVSVRSSARCVFGKRFKKKKFYKNVILRGENLDSQIGQLPSSTIQCE